MIERTVTWFFGKAQEREFLVAATDVFITANFAFLVLDIIIAHGVNQFGHTGEWIPLIFSLVATGALAFVQLRRFRGQPLSGAGSIIETSVAALAILVGVAGLYFHLEGSFFQKMTLHNLVYTAPFVAPLTFTGLGFLLLLNGQARGETPQTNGGEWSRWVVFLALGGFTGNFILSACDHAQNGFFNMAEWIPVFAAAIAVGFLSVIVLARSASESSHFIRLCVYVMIIQAATGLLGFILHFGSLVLRFGADFFPNFIYGAPFFAPLLFVNLSLLALIGLQGLKLSSESEAA